MCVTCGEPMPHVVVPRMSAKAQIALLLGLLSFLLSFVAAIPAIILGFSALRDIRQNSDSLRGRELAWGGISSATLVLVLTCCVAMWMFSSRLLVSGTSSTSTVIVSSDSDWRWLHPIDGVDPATNDEDFHSTFHQVDFNDSDWPQGTDGVGPHAGFGYGDAATNDIGTPSSGQRGTAYFRHRFFADATYRNLFLMLQRDDGVIVYLDGVEVARDNVQPGPDGYELLAIQTASAQMETEVRRIELAGTIEPGEHVLSISLHNRGNNSSDLRIAEISLHGVREED